MAGKRQKGAQEASKGSTPHVSAGGEAKDLKKKKKNGPDRLQPAWLFPPDEENPVLNPKPKSEEQAQADLKARLEAISFLKHKAVGAPLKAPPPVDLLQLIAAFLTSYGYNSTSRIFTTERQSRKTLDGWKDYVGTKRLPKGMPNLVRIYNAWRLQWDEEHADDTSESESGEEASSDEASETPAATKKTAKGKTNGRAGSSDDSLSSSSDSEASEQEPVAKNKPKKSPGVKVGAASSRKPVDKDASSASSASESDSENGSESEKGLMPNGANTSISKAQKRKVESQGSSSEVSSDSSDSSEAESAEPANKKLKVDTSIALSASKSNRPQIPTQSAKPKKEIAVATSSSTSSDDSDSDSEERSAHAAAITTPEANSLKATESRSSSGSSTTLKDVSVGGVAVPIKAVATASSSESESDDDPDEDMETVSTAIVAQASTSKGNKATSKRKRSSSPKADGSTSKTKITKKTAVPFSRISADIKVDPKLASNAYVSYDYADRAHRDLIVTKGKGFTKEKNKKKRGAYRGGKIDDSGGKGIRFED